MPVQIELELELFIELYNYLLDILFVCVLGDGDVNVFRGSKVCLFMLYIFK